MNEGTNPADAPETSRENEKALTPAARRALAEAKARREATQTAANGKPAELHGRGGLDPVRYGDWEIKGLTSDF